MDQADKIIDRFADQSILVVGDLMLDRYIWGNVEQISPEAPVQVLAVDRESAVPGGSGNTAHNIVALGARAAVVGLIGDDEAGAQLRERLAADGVELHALANGRPTTVKTRLVARNQQLMRIDHEQTSPLSDDTEGKLLAVVDGLADRFDAVIVSDYAKGVVTPQLMQHVAARFKIAAVDPVPGHFDLYHDLTLLTPNHVEASRAAGIPERDEADLVRIGAALVERTQSNLLITRGEKGMALFSVGGEPILVGTDAQEVIDVVGAGDTVIAAATLSMAAGADLLLAVRLANLAAGIVVAKVGTAVATQDELRSRLAALNEWAA